MEKTFKLDFNGQQVQQQDFDDIGDSAGLADDRVFAELFRLAPYNGTAARGILPSTDDPASGSKYTVEPAGATGSVKVNPFRALIGSRVSAATEGRKNWRDIRSGLSVAEGSTALSTSLALAANSSGNPRWDAIIATVAVDAASASVTRKVKNVTTGVVTPQSVSTNKVTNVTVSVVTGTPAATPAYPAIPSDSGGSYYILLAYVRVPNGFGAGSTVSNDDINFVANVLGLSTRAIGGTHVRPSSSNSSGAGVQGAGTSLENGLLKWTATAAQRPALYLPPDMTGKEELLLAIDLNDASSANWSHQNGDVLDDTIDWRKRIFKWHAMVAAHGSSDATFPWIQGQPSPIHSTMPSARPLAGVNSATAGPAQGLFEGFGNSFDADDIMLPAGFAHVVGLVSATNVPNTVMVAATSVAVSVDMTTGVLKLHVNGVPRVALFIWLEASGQFRK